MNRLRRLETARLQPHDLPKLANPPTLPQQTDDYMLKMYVRK